MRGHDAEVCVGDGEREGVAMIVISADDASLLAILAVNPKTSHFEKITRQISDVRARDAANVITGRVGATDVSVEAQSIASAVVKWASCLRRP